MLSTTTWKRTTDKFCGGLIHTWLLSERVLPETMLEPKMQWNEDIDWFNDTNTYVPPLVVPTEGETEIASLRVTTCRGVWLQEYATASLEIHTDKLPGNNFEIIVHTTTSVYTKLWCPEYPPISQENASELIICLPNKVIAVDEAPTVTIEGENVSTTQKFMYCTRPGDVETMTFSTKIST